MSLIDFLRARLDEDERVATAAAEYGPPPWSPPDEVWDAMHSATDAIGHDMPSVEVGVHMARHDPARVLAEVAAKRAILEIHTLDTKPETEYFDDIQSHSVSGDRSLTVRGPNGGWRETGRTLYCCRQCDTDRHDEYFSPVEGCDTLRALVSVWADHSDFNPDWTAPTGDLGPGGGDD